MEVSDCDNPIDVEISSVLGSKGQIERLANYERDWSLNAYLNEMADIYR